MKQWIQTGSKAATYTAPIIVVAFVAKMAFDAAKISRDKAFSLDEFEYAHAAFLVARGLVPYRDFVEVHFPFLFQVLAPISALYGTDPTQIAALRAAMLLPLGGTAVAMWVILRRHGRLIAALAPSLLLTTEPLLRFFLEVRGDGLAFALAVVAIALAVDGAGQMRSFIAGLLFGLACWTSQKTLVFGVVVPIALALDFAGPQRTFSGSPRVFVIGAVTVAVVAAAWLTATGAWGLAWYWCFAHFRSLDDWSTIFPWTQSAADIIVGSWHVLAFALAGVVVVTTDPNASSGERMMVAMWPLTFVSIAIQPAPYPYSWIPFLGVACVLAARACVLIVVAVADAPRLRLPLVALLVGLLVAAIHSQDSLRRAVKQETNDYQLAVLRTIDDLVEPNEAIYDNTGSYVARPSLLPRFFTDVLMRRGQTAELEQEVLTAFIDRPPAMVIVDIRFNQLSDAIKTYIRKHYLPYTGELLLPGHEFPANTGAPFRVRVPIARDGAYTVEGLQDASLDGVPVAGEIMLTRGEHVLEGIAAAGGVFVLAVPANHERWLPRPDMKPMFTRLF